MKNIDSHKTIVVYYNSCVSLGNKAESSPTLQVDRKLWDTVCRVSTIKDGTLKKLGKTGFGQRFKNYVCIFALVK